MGTLEKIREQAQYDPKTIFVVDDGYLAARMRIVLAQRTGDGTQLARARAVLERVGDCQYLRKLVEVEAALR